MFDGKTIEARLTSLARRIYTQYQSRLGPECARQLDKAIRVCEIYRQDVGDWGDMHEAVLGESGMCLYSEGEAGDLSEELTMMWVMETCILICGCWLGSQKERAAKPQDMDLQGENIPAFLDLLEGLPDCPPDCARIWEYWNKNLCW